MRQIKVNGCYPEQCVRLLELRPEHVLDMVNEWFVPIGEEPYTLRELQNCGWINKGWRMWSRSHRTAIYKHDGRWHLIQFFGDESIEERNA